MFIALEWFTYSGFVLIMTHSRAHTRSISVSGVTASGKENTTSNIFTQLFKIFESGTWRINSFKEQLYESERGFEWGCENMMTLIKCKY